MSDDRVYVKLDKIENQLLEIDKTLVRNTVSLEHHIMRTEQNEKLITLLSKDLEPVKDHVASLRGVVKAISVASVILAIAVSIFKLVGAL